VSDCGDSNSILEVGPQVAVMTCATGKKYLAVAHQSMYDPNPEQRESLFALHQLQSHGCRVDMTPKSACSFDGTPGKQAMTVGPHTIHLCFDGKKMFVPLSEPTEEDMQTLPRVE